MDNWKELSLIKKILIGTMIIVAAFFAPELMILIDVGGIDLAFGFLLYYYKPVIEWFKAKIDAIKAELQIARDIIVNSALSRPKVFTLNTAYCSICLLVTGSLLFSFSFFLPALMVSGAYV
ncbi:hypothetical protein [Pleionea sp. CnH1-48]|uniref:hypothetical protein n=1 Tax=Pleionea sp. CnH1-48 TaxID=2954494 RepID=UPI002096B991|nr:hypothetical protein [Pleionea sp. CnH1-48]MCO7224114.1 hypothetical protein [Pleionea sp. CnH1-48]